MTIGLMGFEFESANKGCEALSYSFLEVLLKKYDEEKLKIYVFSNQQLGCVKELYPNLNITHIYLKIKDIKFTMIKALLKCDCVYDVTMGDSFSDIYSEEVCLSNMRFKIMAEIFAKRYILLPQTYGPFYSKKVLRRAKKILKKADKIYCRDNKSQEYIKDRCGISNAEVTTDLAFLLPYDKEMYSIESNKIKLGINVSGLLWNGGFTKNNQFGLKTNYSDYIKSLLEYYSKQPNVMVYLIPHVIDRKKDAYDDDYNVCEEISRELKNVILAPVFKTPIEAKSYISNMDVFVGARMHSTIAAFSSGVLTIPFSYSRKFEGLYESLEYPYVISGKKMTTEEAVIQTCKFIECENDLRNQQNISMKNIEEKMMSFQRMI